MKKNQETLAWVLGIGAVAALGALLYSNMNQDVGDVTPMPATGTGKAGGFDRYLYAAPDYTGGLLPWLNRQLNPMPVPEFGVNASPYLGSSTMLPTPDFGVSYPVNSAPSTDFGVNLGPPAPLPWTPAGSADSGFGLNAGRYY